MIKIIVTIILLTLMSCAMNTDDMEIFIIGKWESAPKDTELGEVKMKFTFTKKNTFKVESFFGNQTTPLIVEGKYRLDGSKMIAESWNKGKPIIISKENNQLLLKTDDDLPFILNRELKGSNLE